MYRKLWFNIGTCNIWGNGEHAKGNEWREPSGNENKERKVSCRCEGESDAYSMYVVWTSNWEWALEPNGKWEGSIERVPVCPVSQQHSCALISFIVRSFRWLNRNEDILRKAFPATTKWRIPVWASQMDDKIWLPDETNNDVKTCSQTCESESYCVTSQNEKGWVDSGQSSLIYL